MGHGVRHGLKLGGGAKEVGLRVRLESYFVIKLSVIKCLFNYDNAIIIIYKIKMQVKFINQSKIF